MDKKHCAGCKNNFYNNGGPTGHTKECWSLKDAKIVWRIPVGMQEPPPYKNRKAVRIPDCYIGSGGNQRTIYIKKEALTPEGYWR